MIILLELNILLLPIPRKVCTPSSPSRHPFPIKSYSSVSSIFVHGSAAWLRWHAGIDDELGISFPAHIKPPLPKDCNTSFQAARSILTVLQKLLEISSALTERVALVPMTMTWRLWSCNTAKQQQNNNLQHRPLPPLLSTPLRLAWIECTALYLALGSNLQGNLLTDANSLITKMVEISNWNPRSKMASGGVRLSAK